MTLAPNTVDILALVAVVGWGVFKAEVAPVQILLLHSLESFRSLQPSTSGGLVGNSTTPLTPAEEFARNGNRDVVQECKIDIVRGVPRPHSQLDETFFALVGQDLYQQAHLIESMFDVVEHGSGCRTHMMKVVARGHVQKHRGVARA